jgi:hypothetical protein
MAHDLELLKQRMPLLEYLQRHNWRPCRAGTRQEFVGLCPLHQETRPSFYVNAHKNLFYCHGCGRGGDLIRFVQLFLALPFRQSVAHLEQELMPVPASYLLEQTVDFYQLQLHRALQRPCHFTRRCRTLSPSGSPTYGCLLGWLRLPSGGGRGLGRLSDNPFNNKCS